MNIMFNYPRKIYSLDALRKRINRVCKFESVVKKKLVQDWLTEYVIMSSMHQGDAYRMTLINLSTTLETSMKEYKRDHCFHSKYNKWKIERPSHDVNLGGGSPFYQEEFETEEECLKYIKDNF